MLYSFLSSVWRASALRSSASSTERASPSRARWSTPSTRGLPAGARAAEPPEPDDDALPPPPPEGFVPCTTVTLPPSMILQPFCWATVALLVYSLPQRQTRSCASAAEAVANEAAARKIREAVFI
ncbi:hypothetical protein D9M68_838660 [compost metagenome]